MWSQLNRAFSTFISQYSGVNIGPVHKKDIMKCSTMLEHDSQWVLFLTLPLHSIM